MSRDRALSGFLIGRSARQETVGQAHLSQLSLQARRLLAAVGTAWAAILWVNGGPLSESTTLSSRFVRRLQRQRSDAFRAGQTIAPESRAGRRQHFELRLGQWDLAASPKLPREKGARIAHAALASTHGTPFSLRHQSFPAKVEKSATSSTPRQVPREVPPIALTTMRARGATQWAKVCRVSLLPDPVPGRSPPPPCGKKKWDRPKGAGQVAVTSLHESVWSCGRDPGNAENGVHGMTTGVRSPSDTRACVLPGAHRSCFCPPIQRGEQAASPLVYRCCRSPRSAWISSARSWMIRMSLTKPCGRTFAISCLAGIPLRCGWTAVIHRRASCQGPATRQWDPDVQCEKAPSQICRRSEPQTRAELCDRGKRRILVLHPRGLSGFSVLVSHGALCRVGACWSQAPRLQATANWCRSLDPPSGPKLGGWRLGSGGVIRQLRVGGIRLQRSALTQFVQLRQHPPRSHRPLPVARERCLQGPVGGGV